MKRGKSAEKVDDLGGKFVRSIEWRRNGRIVERGTEKMFAQWVQHQKIKVPRFGGNHDHCQLAMAQIGTDCNSAKAGQSADGVFHEQQKAKIGKL